MKHWTSDNAVEGIVEEVRCGRVSPMTPAALRSAMFVGKTCLSTSVAGMLSWASIRHTQHLHVLAEEAPLPANRAAASSTCCKLCRTRGQGLSCVQSYRILCPHFGAGTCRINTRRISADIRSSETIGTSCPPGHVLSCKPSATRTAMMESTLSPELSHQAVPWSMDAARCASLQNTAR